MSEIDKFDEENESNFITLADDEGNDVHFEFLDAFDYNERSFIVLLPFEDTEDEVVILEMLNSTDNSEECEYLSIDDDQLLNDLFEEFKRRNVDNFDFED